MSRQDYYVLLGVARSASKSEIRRAFRKLARKFHPDINPGDNVAALRYQRIHEAFEVLTDQVRREQYDKHGSKPETTERIEPARYGFEGFDFTLSGGRDVDIFPDLFVRRSRRSEQARADGGDIHHRVSISFEDSMMGIASELQLVRNVACETCEGFREIPAAQPRPCTTCGGRGSATQSRGFMLFTKRCSDCDGAGVVEREPCPDCRGVGLFAREQNVRVEIPKGVSDGDRLSVPGLGHQGRGAARAGDLHVHVQVHPHAFFTRKGDNLFCTVPITFTEAALGTKLSVPTPDGSVTLRVPAGVQSGQKLRLSERGAPSRRGSDGRGDLFVTIQVTTPTIYDDRSRELLRELDRLNPSEPRRELWKPTEPTEEVSR